MVLRRLSDRFFALLDTPFFVQSDPAKTSSINRLVYTTLLTLFLISRA